MTTMKEEKQTYAKPAVRIVELRSRGLLMLSGDGVSSMRNGYGKASVEDGTEQTWQ